ncbi:glycosyltransferase [Amycolatopsis keratiniphila]|uniref:Glycosyl transferase n=2 Tax=Amycolatopsis TaxID=1813 RepID=R4SKH3_9PSEU|nr:glycosyltransferase [Amycolatopsis keratiniphila]AAB49298.1 glycosyltransferase GtfD [Amycolatopsis orientalis]AEI58872.1 glycosyltransferase [Amycolatopsis orientalis HCCB10007]AGM04074.1 glycosyl transferase [Amycolatopsis keratiniphila]
MRVLLSVCGTRGDVEIAVSLAVRLKALGVGTRMCAPPAAAERLAEVEVPHVPVGLPQHMMLQEGMPPPPPEEERRLAAMTVEMQFDAIPSAAEGCVAVVAVGDLAAATGVRSVAEKLGLPFFYSVPSPVYLASPHFPPPYDEPTTPGVTDHRTLWEERAHRFAERYGETLNRRRAAIGLPPVEDVFGYGHGDRPILSADPVLAPLQPDVDAVQTGAWILTDDRPLPPELEAFLAAGPPPVHVGFGSSSGKGIADAAKIAVEVSRAHGRRVILSRGWTDLLLPDDREDCFAIGEVNFQALFPRVAAVIHHGSAGTEHVATRAGVPQLVIPRNTDQPYFAARVADLGIGVAHDGPTPTFESLSAALTTVLAPETRARARAVAAMAQTDGAAAAADLVLAAVGGNEPAVPA